MIRAVLAGQDRGGGDDDFTTEGAHIAMPRAFSFQRGAYETGASRLTRGKRNKIAHAKGTPEPVIFHPCMATSMMMATMIATPISCLVRTCAVMAARLISERQ
jgi:hypothetical protein